MGLAFPVMDRSETQGYRFQCARDVDEPADSSRHVRNLIG